jgi:hypothetical protein
MNKMNRMKQLVSVLAAIMALSCGWAGLAGGAELGFYRQGDVNLNGPAYAWWYGCSPTSAGMMMGYYDQKGYGGLYYSDLVPGGVAEANTFGGVGWGYKVNNIIASKGNVADFYSGGYGASGDDVKTSFHAFDSLADFMGTSQDLVANSNGSTTFFYWTNGQKFTAADASYYNVWNQDGMYGMDEYLRYTGYGTGQISDDKSFYTQLIYSTSATSGAKFADYKALIDAGLVAMIQVDGHSMFGYGYDDAGNIILHDTWDGLQHSMPWGGTYSGMKQWGITVFTPSGGSAVPLPSTLLLMISGLGGLAGLRFWRRPS